ncbi:MAG: hypothetical protein EXX96DRAFT_262405 [Benjaminiella poitrasii]|nr:MAG: hypothetical protein EXX96DRAFT_262405 [Benjaminiella poitrasii]
MFLSFLYIFLHVYIFIFAGKFFYCKKFFYKVNQLYLIYFSGSHLLGYIVNILKQYKYFTFNNSTC